ncbi:MAG: hypothetical protein QOJ64_4323 [Acidobacteriota bacterium]|jgi:hypothetical protein|nr:hypothetical protein [Acidobacteriota bacterium]
MVVGFAVLISICLCFDEASAQRTRNKRSRRVTNPVATAPRTVVPSTQSTDPQIISTADQQTNSQDNASDLSGEAPTSRPSRRRTAQPPDDESMRRTVNDLSNQVTKLTDKLTEMEKSQRVLVDLERLSRAEQRAELLRTQMRDVQDKEGNLLGRSEQIEYDLKPENIERSVATYGSTRPEEARDARRRALESEKIRVRAQLDSLATSKQRLDTAIINADLEIDRLQKRLEDSPEPPPKENAAENTNDTNDAEEPDSTSTTAPGRKAPPSNSTTPPR